MTTTLVLDADRVVTPEGVITGGRLVARGRLIRSVGARSGSEPVPDRHAAWMLPGPVDLHCHGGAGASLGSDSLDEVHTALGFHRRHGTTTSLISLVSAPLDGLVTKLRRLSDWLDDPATGLAERAIGIHLEGPFLSTARCGAIDPDTMIDANDEAVDALLTAAEGWLRVITVAPERPGVLEVIPRLVDAGVVVAIGHTDAGAEVVHEAIGAGARLATHLGNAMAPFHHRRPGPVGACLANPAVTAELIVDGHHLHADTVRFAAAAKGRHGVTLCTDAVAAAGTDARDLTFDGRSVHVVDGAVRLGPDGVLAGSTLTMDRAVANGVAMGLDVEDVARATATNPARVIGLDDRGTLAPGRRADAVLFDDDWRLVAVCAGGELTEVDRT